jgi:S1-C subfamily serine protease
MRLWVVLAVLLAGPVAAAAESCTEPLRTVFARVAPSVVSIQSMKINKAKPHGRFETIAGSGVIIDKDGQILTNAHVVDGAASLSVGLDSRHRVTARIVGLDPVLDLALLRVETASPASATRSWPSATPSASSRR